MLHGHLAPSPVRPGPEHSSTYVMTAWPVPLMDLSSWVQGQQEPVPTVPGTEQPPGEDSPSELKQESGARFSELVSASGILLTHWFLWVWMFLDCMS